MSKPVFLAFLALLTIMAIAMAQSPEDDPRMAEFVKAADTLSTLTTLKYGEACNYQDGLKLRDLSLRIYSSSAPGKSRDVEEDQTIKDMQALLNSKYCDGSLALQCKENGKCDCAQEATPGIELHAEVVEPGKCRLSKGSPCYSDVSAESGMVCVAGTKCLLKSDGKSECRNPAAAARMEPHACQCV